MERDSRKIIDACTFSEFSPSLSKGHAGRGDIEQQTKSEGIPNANGLRWVFGGCLSNGIAIVIGLGLDVEGNVRKVNPESYRFG